MPSSANAPTVHRAAAPRLEGWLRLQSHSSVLGCGEDCVCSKSHPIHLPRAIRLPTDDDEAAALVLGRSSKCSIQLDDLQHLTMVSREHCRVRLAPGARDEWTVEDLRSANGTAVGEKRLLVGEAMPLTHGAVLTIGSRGVSLAKYRVEVAPALGDA